MVQNMQLKQHLDAVIEKEIEQEHVAGAAMLVLHNGQPLYSGCFGLADLQAQTSMTDTSILRMYSNSKPVTAAAAMLLVQRGMLDLWTPVKEYLPGFAGQKYIEDGKLQDVQRDMLVRDLLNMTSGLVYPEDSPAGKPAQALFDEQNRRIAAGGGLSTVEFCNEMGRLPLAFTPGKTWKYGTSADVLGAVIELAAGMPFGKFLQKEFFEPLGMEDTGFWVPKEKRERCAKIYNYRQTAPHLTPYTGDNLAITTGETPPRFESGGAGLFSTLRDYSKFCTLLLQGGSFAGQQILSRKTMEFMTSNQLTPEQLQGFDWPALSGYGYGNLLRVMQDTAKWGAPASLGEFGWDGWAGTFAAIDPVEKLVILYFIQRLERDDTLLRRKLRSLIYAAL